MSPENRPRLYHDMFPADILNIRYRPGEQQVRECLKWIFEDHSIPYGEECWLTKDKEDFIEGEKEGNIADIIFTDKEIHDLAALELKGKHLPKKKALEQLKTYRKFVDRTYLVCSHIDFDKEFLDQCNKLGVGVVSLTINMKMITESKHDALTKLTKSHLLKLRKYYFFELLSKFNVVVNSSDRYYETFDKYASILLDKNKTPRDKLIDEWKRQWMEQIASGTQSVVDFIAGRRREMQVIHSGEKITAWIHDDNVCDLAAPGHTWKFESYKDMLEFIEVMHADLEQLKNHIKIKPPKISLAERDDR